VWIGGTKYQLTSSDAPMAAPTPTTTGHVLQVRGAFGVYLELVATALAHHANWPTATPITSSRTAAMMSSRSLIRRL
jgi:hypothetical protein